MSPMKTIILGAGFGGLTVANRLRKLLPLEHEILLVDKSPDFIVGAAKTWVMLGKRKAVAAHAPLERLVLPGVRLVQDEILDIDPLHCRLSTREKELQGDAMVIALGADLNMGSVPGLADAAQTFFTLDGAERLRHLLDRFDEGEIVLLIPRTPFKCPPAPYEAALLLQDSFEERGLKNAVHLSVYTMEPAPMATAGPEVGKLVTGQLHENGIAFHPQKKTLHVDSNRQVVAFEDGDEIQYDLLIAIPPHEAPKVVREAGLAEPGSWIPVDPETMQVVGLATGRPLYAIGDVTTVPLPGRYKPGAPLVLPKAGVMAEAQGEVVAEHLASLALGAKSENTFNGQGVCYIETGADRAIQGKGSFFSLPHPVMEMTPPDHIYYQEKLDWVRARLEGHLGISRS